MWPRMWYHLVWYMVTNFAPKNIGNCLLDYRAPHSRRPQFGYSTPWQLQIFFYTSFCTGKFYFSVGCGVFLPVGCEQNLGCHAVPCGWWNSCINSLVSKWHYFVKFIRSSISCQCNDSVTMLNWLSYYKVTQTIHYQDCQPITSSNWFRQAELSFCCCYCTVGKIFLVWRIPHKTWKNSNLQDHW